MKLLLFKVHAGDPLSKVIVGETRTQYTHAAVLVDELTNKICEAYVPHVRLDMMTGCCVRTDILKTRATRDWTISKSFASEPERFHRARTFLPLRSPSGNRRRR